MLSQSQASDIFDRIKKYSTADEVEVLFSGGKSALTRFANNTIHQNVAEENYAVSVRTVFGKRTARSTTNKLDDESGAKANVQIPGVVAGMNYILADIFVIVNTNVSFSLG